MEIFPKFKLIIASAVDTIKRRTAEKTLLCGFSINTALCIHQVLFFLNTKQANQRSLRT